MKIKKLLMSGILAVAMVFMASCNHEEYSPATDKGSEAEETKEAEEADASENEGADEEASIEKSEETEEAEEAEEESQTEKIDYESEIRNHYIAKKEYEELIRALLLGNLESARYIELVEGAEDTNYRKVLTDALMADTVDSTILSEGIKNAIDGVCERKSVDEIVKETAAGLFEGMQNEMESAVQETIDESLTGIKELKLFEAATWISEFLNVDDTPVGLLNGMVERQRADVETMTLLLQQEEFNNGELLYAAALYKRLCSRQNEIILAGGTAQKMEQEVTLDELIQKWNSENSMILALNAMRENKGFEISSQCKQDVFHFRDFNIQGLPACYDVAGYREKQKNTEQTKILSEQVFGGLLGSVVADDIENNQMTIQEERIKFYKLLEGSLEQSYMELCAAKSNLDILYGTAFKEITGNEDNMQAVDEQQIYEALKELVNAVCKYTFDLKTAKVFWENTLSENETNYLGMLTYQLDRCYALLEKGMELGIMSDGYSVEEEYSRYVSMMDAYADYLYWSMIYIHSEPVYSYVSSLTAYGVGNFNIYCWGKDFIPLVFAEEQINTNNHGERYLWVYNKEGEPLYISERHAKVYVMDDLVIEMHSPSGEILEVNDVAFKLYNNAKKIREDYDNVNLSHGYKEYVY